MHRSRRKKILIWVLLIVLLVVVLGYAFRYPLIRKFQYSRLGKIHCRPDNALGRGADCLNRIWAHRVNTIERLDILEDKFHGFETDIVYDDSLQAYSVYHPPKPDGDILSLEEFIKNIDFTTKRLWLDTRGIDSFNMRRALNALNQITAPRRIGYGLVIETYDLSAAALFAENGYTVTLNVSERLLQRLMTNSTLKDSLNSILAKVKFVSQDYHYISPLKQFFPDKRIMTWRPEFNVFIDTEELQKLMDDPHIYVVLVSIKSRYYK